MKKALLLAFISFSLVGFSQDQTLLLTLDDCIATALANNIQLQQTKNNLIVAKAQKFQAIFNYLPSVSAGGGYYIRNGNFFDNTVDRFITETTRSFSVGAQAELVLFNGLSNKHNLQSSLHDAKASEKELESQKITVEANVLQTYLSILLDKENLKISNERVELLTAQLDRATKRESVGVGNLEDVYNFKSQLANERLTKVNAENQLQRDYLTLAQTLRLETEAFDVESFDQLSVAELTEQLSYPEVLMDALGYSPDFQRAQHEFQSSRYSYHSSYANFLPRVTAFYSYGTGWSSNGAINPDTGLPEQNAQFFTQLDYNIQPSLGIEFSIPIFSRFANRTTYQTSKVAMLNAQLEIEQAEITISNTVQQVFQDMIAAQSSYSAAQENLEALEQSFAFSKKRYETGNTDFYTYLESLNNKNRAQLQLINAKYSIVFRKKILELYRGS